MGLPSLETVIVSGDCEYPLLQDAQGLEKSLKVQDVRLYVKFFHHGEWMPLWPLSFKFMKYLV